MITYIPLPGTPIDEACETAIEIMKKRGEPVSFTFNRMPLKADQATTADALEAKYFEELAKKHEALKA